MKTADVLKKSGLLQVTLVTADLIKANEILDKEIQAFKKEVAELIANIKMKRAKGEEEEEEEEEVALDSDEKMKGAAQMEKREMAQMRNKPRAILYHQCPKHGAGGRRDVEMETEEDEEKGEDEEEDEEEDEREEKQGLERADNKSSVSYQSRDSGMGSSVISEDGALGENLLTRDF